MSVCSDSMFVHCSAQTEETSLHACESMNLLLFKHTMLMVFVCMWFPILRHDWTFQCKRQTMSFHYSFRLNQSCIFGIKMQCNYICNYYLRNCSCLEHKHCRTMCTLNFTIKGLITSLTSSIDASNSDAWFCKHYKLKKVHTVLQSIKKLNKIKIQLNTYFKKKKVLLMV